MLADRRTTFVVVTTLEASPLHEAEFFMEALQAPASCPSAPSS